MEKRPSPEHRRKLLCKPLECFLNGSTVIQKCSGGFLPFGRNITHGRFHVIWYPVHKCRRMRVLHLRNGFFDISHGKLASEHGGSCEISSLSWITSHHHVLGSKHIACEFGDGVRSEALRTLANERRVGGDEKMKTRKWYHVYGEFSEVRVELPDRGQWINCKTSHMHSFWRLSSQTSFISAIKLQSYYNSFAGQRYFWPTPRTESSGLKLPWARESTTSADLSTLWKRV